MGVVAFELAGPEIEGRESQGRCVGLDEVSGAQEGQIQGTFEARQADQFGQKRKCGSSRGR